MGHMFSLFVGSFTTLLAIINPLEALPVFLKLLEGKDLLARRAVAKRSCLYAAGLMLFFLVFGNLILRAFEVALSMVRIVGGIVLMRIGFSLFIPSGADPLTGVGGEAGEPGDVAFVPLAMPIMFGPGGIATIIGMSALVRHTESPMTLLGIVAAIVATMGVTYLILIYADPIVRRVGTQGIDAATRLVGFFVSTMGMALIFHGLEEVLRTYGVVAH